MESSRSLSWRIRWMSRYWKKHRGMLLVLLIMTVISTTVALAYPLIFRTLLDRITSTGDSGDDKSIESLLVVLGFIAFGRIIAAFYPALRARMNLLFEMAIRETTFRRILEKDHRFFTRFRTGDVVTRLSDDLADYPKVTWFMCSGVFRALDSGSKLIFCATAMMLLNSRLTLLSLVPLAPLFIFFYVVRKALYEAFEAQQKSISTTNSMLESVFSGIRIVKGFTNEDGQSRRLNDILRPRVDVQLRVAKLHVLFHSLETLASHMGQVIVLAAGGLMVIKGNLSAGTLYAIFVYLDMLVYPIMDLPNLFVTARQAFVCIDRIEEIASFPVTVERGKGKDNIEGFKRIELRNVSASYDGGANPVLHGINLTVHAGEIIALAGPVGCGKSTVLRILAGLMKPEHGAVIFNGIPLDQVDWDAYRRLLGYVPQDTLLFSESIADNVSCGRTVDSSVISSALEVAQIRHEIDAMQHGIDTVLSTKGHSLSGGQRGRVAIARAIAGNPSLFLFDDCTAALDARSEDGFWRNIIDSHPHAGFVVVSHRIATIRRAQRVAFIKDGEIMAEGSHEELIKRCDQYVEFIAREELREHLGMG